MRQAIHKLRQAEVQLSKDAPSGAKDRRARANLLPLADGLRRATAGSAKRLKALETENTRLEKMAVDNSCGAHMKAAEIGAARSKIRVSGGHLSNVGSSGKHCHFKANNQFESL
ncbi:MAG: hypothetical protein GTN69_03865 [Armatimonadetes bacterium]|nr:hypothetical protein [Armatimonadota bacterium]